MDKIVDRSHPKFVMIDHLILDMGLTMEAFCTYAELKKYARHDTHECFPSYSRLSKVFKGSYPNGGDSTLRKKAIAAVTELCDRGLLRKESRSCEHGGFSSNLYILTPPSDWVLDAEGYIPPSAHKPNNRTAIAGRGGSPSELPSSPSEPGGVVLPANHLVLPANPNYNQLTKTNSLTKTTPPLPPKGKKKGEGVEEVEQVTPSLSVAALSNQTWLVERSDTYVHEEDPTPTPPRSTFSNKRDSHEPIKLNSHETMKHTIDLSDLDGESDPFLVGRARGKYEGSWRSQKNDPWMETANNVNPGFRDWLCDRRSTSARTWSRADASAEIRNDAVKARDLWLEYTGEETTVQTNEVVAIDLEGLAIAIAKGEEPDRSAIERLTSDQRSQLSELIYNHRLNLSRS